MVMKIAIVLFVLFCVATPSSAQTAATPPNMEIEVVFLEGRQPISMREAYNKARAQKRHETKSKKAEENSVQPAISYSLPINAFSVQISSSVAMGEPPADESPPKWLYSLLAVPVAMLGRITWRRRRFAPLMRDMNRTIEVYAEEMENLWTDPDRKVVSKSSFNFPNNRFVLSFRERHGGYPSDVTRKLELVDDLDRITLENLDLYYTPDVSTILYDNQGWVRITFFRKEASA